MERQPKTCEEASEFAENYSQARSTTKKPKVPSTKCPRCGNRGHWARDCPQPRVGTDGGRKTQASTAPNQPHSSLKDTRNSSNDVQKVRCYACNEKGFYASSCPKRSYSAQANTAPTEDRARRGGVVNGIYCPDILVDTGATQTLAHKILLTSEDFLDDTVEIRYWWKGHYQYCSSISLTPSISSPRIGCAQPSYLPHLNPTPYQ